MTPPAVASSRHKVPKLVFRAVFLEGCSSPFMRLAEHLTALRAWCKQCLPLVGENPTCSMSRHGRDARVYGHTTTAMHEYRAHPPFSVGRYSPPFTVSCGPSSTAVPRQRMKHVGHHFHFLSNTCYDADDTFFFVAGTILADAFLQLK